MSKTKQLVLLTTCYFYTFYTLPMEHISKDIVRIIWTHSKESNLHKTNKQLHEFIKEFAKNEVKDRFGYFHKENTYISEDLRIELPAKEYSQKNHLIHAGYEDYGIPKAYWHSIDEKTAHAKSLSFINDTSNTYYWYQIIQYPKYHDKIFNISKIVSDITSNTDLIFYNSLNDGRGYRNIFLKYINTNIPEKDQISSIQKTILFTIQLCQYQDIIRPYDNLPLKIDLESINISMNLEIFSIFTTEYCKRIKDIYEKQPIELFFMFNYANKTIAPFSNFYTFIKTMRSINNKKLCDKYTKIEKELETVSKKYHSNEIIDSEAIDIGRKKKKTTAIELKAVYIKLFCLSILPLTITFPSYVNAYFGLESYSPVSNEKIIESFIGNIKENTFTATRLYEQEKEDQKAFQKRTQPKQKHNMPKQIIATTPNQKIFMETQISKMRIFFSSLFDYFFIISFFLNSKSKYFPCLCYTF